MKLQQCISMLDKPLKLKIGNSCQPVHSGKFISMKQIFKNHNRRSQNDLQQMHQFFLKYLFSYPLSASKKLNAKYEHTYSFFTAKNINQLIYSVGNSLCIKFDQLKAYYDDVQYLKRAYKEVGLTGKNEIQERIRMIASQKIEYYENETIGHNLPMMLESKINEVFRKRVNRLRKIRHQSQIFKSQVSSSSFGSSSLSFSFDEQILKDIDLEFSQLMMEESSKCLKKAIDFEQVQSIYEAQPNLDSDCLFQQNCQPQIQRTDSRHNSFQQDLIIDFQEIDAESVINFYRDIKKRKNGSEILSGIIQEQQKLGKKSSKSPSSNNETEKTSKKSSQKVLQKTKKKYAMDKYKILQSYRDVFDRASNSNNYRKKIRNLNPEMNPDLHNLSYLMTDNENFLEDKNLPIGLKTIEQEIQRTRSNQAKRRESIRQKAERLLEGIRLKSFS